MAKPGDDAMRKVGAAIGFVLVCGGAFAEDGADWGRTGAMPEPQADSRGRAGAWWQPSTPSSNDDDSALWGNRGRLFGTAQEVSSMELVEPPWVREEGTHYDGIPVLDFIKFDFDSSDMDSEGRLTADKVVRDMKEYPTDTAVVEGHTCDLGDSEYNFALGLRRAQTVVDYLVEHGIDPSRLKAVSKADTEPAVPNNSKENRAYNRRAVLQFTLGE
jgi:outer membrane protein OmpA-like peptidoglycan-associated protein